MLLIVESVYNINIKDKRFTNILEKCAKQLVIISVNEK